MLTNTALIVTHAQLFILLAISVAALIIAFGLWWWLRLLRSRRTARVVALVESLIKEKRWEEASRELGGFLRGHPASGDLLYLQGEILHGKKVQQFEERLSRIEHLTRSKEWGEAHRELDIILREDQARTEAIRRSVQWKMEVATESPEDDAYFRRARREPAPNPKVLELQHRIDRGERLEAIEEATRAGDWAKAAELISSAITSYPGEPSFERLKVELIDAVQGRLDSAQSSLRSLITADELDDAERLLELGREFSSSPIWCELDLEVERRKQFASLLEEARNAFAAGDFHRANDLLESLPRIPRDDRIRELRDNLRRVIAESHETQALRAEAEIADLIQNHQWDRARQAVENALGQNPRSHALRNLYAQLNDRERAERIKQAFSNKLSHVLRLWEGGKFEEAEHLLRRLVL